VPVDFSETSKKALQYAVRFAEQFGAKLTVLNAIEPVATPDFAYHPLLLEADKVKQATKARLEALCSQMGIQGARTTTHYGTPFAEICEAARKQKVDLIVIATHGFTGLKHVLLGSTAERVVRHAPCPVLTVREKEHEFA
jgi:nucleotide-binding universal stress UspA family protein